MLQLDIADSVPNYIDNDFLYAPFNDTFQIDYTQDETYDISGNFNGININNIGELNI